METSQEPPQDLAIYLGLQGFEIESVEIVNAPWRTDPGRRIKVVHLLRRSGLHMCSECGKGHPESLFEEFDRIRFPDCSIGDFETYVEVRAMRLTCCGATRVERMPFAMEGFRMTRRFFERVAALCTKLPIFTVAEMAGLSWDTVARVDKRAIELALGDRTLDLKHLRWIGVDEVSRTGGHVYFTIVTDMESGRVVWIGDGKGEKGLLPFLEALGSKGCRRLRGVVSDLGYKGVIDTHLPRVIHILDRFHIVQWVNEALNQIRRRLFSGAPTDELGRRSKRTGKTEHLDGDCRYAAKSWSKRRRVIIKAEVVRLDGREPRDNARFVITNLRDRPRAVYEDVYCQRGDVENRIKELHHGLEIDRTSCTRFWANQLRVLITAAAFVLMQELRSHAAGTSCARAQVTTIRERLIKLGVWVQQSVRRIVLHLPAAFPFKDDWYRLARALGASVG